MLSMRPENRMQAASCFNMCSGGILHLIELEFNLKNGCGQYKALYLHLHGGIWENHKFKFANFQPDI
jgi:hypothetical protein